jgi:flagellar protein FlgJ
MAAPPINFYADFQGLASLRNDAKAQAPAALEEAAKQFESLFTQLLLKSMREANRSFGDSMFGGEQGEFYQDMFDDQIAMQLSKGKGLGLADMLIRQLSMASVPGAADASKATAGAPAAAQTSDTASSTPIASSREDFIRSMWPHAQQAAREIGVDPHALLAQAALETGWGRSVPCAGNGDCSYNLFGIKAGSQWSGATVNVATLEFESGIPVRKVERFRSYESAADSFRDYAALMRGSARYEDVVGSGSDVASFAAALQRGGYATDPSYAQKVVATAAQVRAVVGELLKSHGDAPLTNNGGVRS